MNYMANVFSASVSDAQRDFMKKHNISMSQLAQEKLDEVMKEKDPETFQRRLNEISSKEKTIESIWQKSLNAEPNFNKRKMLVFECLDNIGINTSNWIERITTEKELENDTTN